MKLFIESKFMFLIKESTKKNVSIVDWEQSYEMFASDIFTAKEKYEKELLHNSLCYAKVEFTFLKYQNGMKKKSVNDKVH